MIESALSNPMQMDLTWIGLALRMGTLKICFSA